MKNDQEIIKKALTRWLIVLSKEAMRGVFKESDLDVSYDKNYPDYVVTDVELKNSKSHGVHCFLELSNMTMKVITYRKNNTKATININMNDLPEDESLIRQMTTLIESSLLKKKKHEE
jgi:hypothetical protein